MKPKKRFAKSFYEKRDLPAPRQEWWPENAGELRDLITKELDGPPLLLLGDGQHTRNALIGEHTFDAVRTTKCNQVLSVDRESKLVRVEAGITWADLQTELTERGLTMERYRLYPSNSTLGGLLARHVGVGRELWNGNLKTGCVALSSATPALAKYRYIAAPRKASGPDSRYLFIGGEGLYGAILDATLVAWRPSEGLLFQWDATAMTALDFYRKVHDLGVRISWAHFAGNELSVAVHANERILKGIRREFDTHIPGYRTLDRAELADFRATLEAAHPDRRELANSRRTLTAYLSLEHLPSAIEELGESVENIEIWDWSRRNARVFLRFPKNARSMELPPSVATMALEWRPLIDDNTVHWPHWVQNLKSSLDPHRRLAIGP